MVQVGTTSINRLLVMKVVMESGMVMQMNTERLFSKHGEFLGNSTRSTRPVDRSHPFEPLLLPLWILNSYRLMNNLEPDKEQLPLRQEFTAKSNIKDGRNR